MRKNLPKYSRTVVNFTALILLFAAAMKWEELPVVTRMGNRLVFQPWFVIGQIILESTLGLWLITGLWAHWGKKVALVMFSIFAIVTLYQAIHGVDSCGCFGQIKINPWISFILDSLIVCGLFLWSFKQPSNYPHALPDAPNKFILWRSLLLILGIATISALVGWRMQPLAINGNPGIIFTKDGIAVLDIDNWVGKKFPISSYLEPSPTTSLNKQRPGYVTGTAIMIFYSNECEHCQKALPIFLARIHERHDPASFWFIEIPPFATKGNELVRPRDNVNHLQLNNSQEWFIETPAIVKLVDGTVVRVITGKDAEDVVGFFQAGLLR